MARVKKIVNAIPHLVPEVLEGLVLASHGDLRKLDGADAVVRRSRSSMMALMLSGVTSPPPRPTR